MPPRPNSWPSLTTTLEMPIGCQGEGQGRKENVVPKSFKTPTNCHVMPNTGGDYTFFLELKLASN